ncbi:ABC transporter permease [Actinomadura pelletieri]|nr:ABC transporter permease [Actinomadura pelletieri]
MLGTILGVGSFVAVLGLTATAASQIGREFNLLRATTVTVTDVTSQTGSHGNTFSDQTGVAPPVAFPPDAEAKVSRLNGVVAAGVWWSVDLGADPLIAGSPAVRPGANADAGQTSTVLAASPGTFAAIEAKLGHGAFFSSFHENRGEAVCVIGSVLAERLGIRQLATRPAVFVNGRPFTVVGILSDVSQLPETLQAVVIPRSTATEIYGPPRTAAPAQMLIRTRIGAAELIARQAAFALRADKPKLLAAKPPPDPQGLRNRVKDELGGLFLVLAGICLTIGALGIANTTFVAVLERTGEIGLRRALGAKSRHIAMQFLAESTALGLLGGLIGTSLAIGAVLSVAVAREWSAVLEPLTVMPAPFIGGLTGFLAGIYPALRAALIEPQDALRSY